MIETEKHDEALQDVLHHAVDHIHASPDLAQRVEGAARRRRTTRRSAAGAMALAAVVTTGVLAAGNTRIHQGASPTYSTSRAPACAANESAYQQPLASRSPALTHVAAGPVVPGSPVAAVVCRFGAGGDLAASATVTSQSQLDRLRAAMNASQAYKGPMYCMASGLSAVIVFAYPQGAADLTVIYGGACASLYTNGGKYLVRGDVDALITAWTGNWQSEANPSVK
jgi:hypothetical protein